MEERFYWLGWSVFPGVGPGRFKLLLNHFGSAKDAWDVDQPELKNIIGEKLALDFEKFKKTFSIERYLEKLQKKEVWFLTQKDKEYPSLLLQIDKPPILLFGKGRIDEVARGPVVSFPPVNARLGLTSFERLRVVGSPPADTTPRKSKSPPSLKLSDESHEMFMSNRTIAIVGTRRITSYGREVTEILTRELVQSGFTIVSGLALGVDAIAHKTAIESGGKTIAVMGCGVDLCYPSSNKKLYEKIIDGNGVVVSEFPIGMTPNVGSFPSRNRIIAGLSQGVLVTEGAEDSGSLITADYALKYGRKVFAVPGPITSGLSRGPSKLIQRGAKLVTNANDILQDFKFEIRNSKSPPRGEAGKIPKDITKEEEKILSILQNEPLQFDEIVRKINMDPAKAGSLLTVMEIKGMIKNLENGMFSMVV